MLTCCENVELLLSVIFEIAANKTYPIRTVTDYVKRLRKMRKNKMQIELLVYVKYAAI